jgi:hypothetical protein
VSAPLNVESVITHDRERNRHVIHFVAFLGVRDAHSTATDQSLVPLMEEMWRYRAQIRLEAQVRRASALSPRTEIRFDATKVDLDTAEIHDAVIIEL